jgi:hypothetical protein
LLLKHLMRARSNRVLEEMRALVGDFSRRELLYQGIFRDAAAAQGLKLPPRYPPALSLIFTPAFGAAQFY